MTAHNIVLPSKPRIVSEQEWSGSYEIDGLYPGYGHTLGNSLRRIILSSLPGAAITEVKIEGVSHEFSTIPGVKEDVVTLLINLKRIRIKMLTDEPQTLSLSIKGAKEVTAGDLTVPGQVEVLNPELVIAHTTEKGTELNMELKVERGLGFVAKEVLQKEKVDIGTITLDAIFTPIRRVNYEVENMRVGDRTDFNRLKVFIETDGTVTPHQALEQSIEIMINQLRAIVGFKEEEELRPETETESSKEERVRPEIDAEILKTRIDTLDLSQRTVNALTEANIRTVGGLVRKKEEDILDIDGLGSKGIQEIKRMLSNYGITLK
ncbi:DNA-directed RNA polymerase subunit alpha [Candidatus Parcubacteria bacterium]|nr:DNA-directed RNA polymerase subunit alpha [Candidatus Parcubacteria bacterium]